MMQDLPILSHLWYTIAVECAWCGDPTRVCYRRYVETKLTLMRLCAFVSFIHLWMKITREE